MKHKEYKNWNKIDLLQFGDFFYSLRSKRNHNLSIKMNSLRLSLNGILYRFYIVFILIIIIIEDNCFMFSVHKFIYTTKYLYHLVFAFFVPFRFQVLFSSLFNIFSRIMVMIRTNPIYATKQEKYWNKTFQVKCRWLVFTSYSLTNR